jgi:hypothetical protein
MSVIHILADRGETICLAWAEGDGGVPVEHLSEKDPMRPTCVGCWRQLAEDVNASRKAREGGRRWAVRAEQLEAMALRLAHTAYLSHLELCPVCKPRYDLTPGRGSKMAPILEGTGVPCPTGRWLAEWALPERSH